MTTRRNFIAASAFAASSLSTVPSGLAQTAAPSAPVGTPAAIPVADWRETYAYTLGMQAFVFGFPWVFLPEIRWKCPERTLPDRHHRPNSISESATTLFEAVNQLSDIFRNLGD
jgi:hypothetical protein